MDDLVTWLRAQWDEDERVAKEASRQQHGDGWTPTGEHWHWVEPDADQVLPLNPVLDDYLNEGGRAALRSVEEYPSTSGMPWKLPHFVVPHSEEMRTTDAMHIARWDPARVLAEVEAKRRILDYFARDASYDLQAGGILPQDLWNRVSAARQTVKLLALPHAGRDGYRAEWKP